MIRSSARTNRFRSQFEASDPPDPGAGDWGAWPDLMAAGSEDGSPHSAMCFRTDSGFGTSSSALLALPSPEEIFKDPPATVQWLFAPGPPDSAGYVPVQR